MAAIFIFPPIPLDKTGLATEAKQDATISKIQDVVDEVVASNVELAAININTDNIEDDLVAIIGYIDEVEINQVIAQASLSSMDSKLSTINTSLNSVETNTDALSMKVAAALVTEKHDFISMTYVGATTDISTVTYKDGGATGATVATLTLGYDGSNRLISVTKA